MQAMVELNIPSHQKVISIDELERYWDSEAPRIGEAHPSQAGVARWLETQPKPDVGLSGKMLQAGSAGTVRLPPEAMLPSSIEGIS